MAAAENHHLSMVRLWLDAARVAAEMPRIGLPLRQEDSGYLVHASLAALFGNGTLQPFRILDGTKRWLPVLAYTTRKATELEEYARAFADPGRFVVCDWERFAIKPMPLDWDPWRRLGFEVRICPVVRLASETEVLGIDGTTQAYQAGAEVDAWVHRKFFGEQPPLSATREEVYRDWLQERLDGAVRIDGARLLSFRRIRLARRSHGQPRRAHIIERPDAILCGNLTVCEPSVFSQVLKRGVGRHRAFGFGMLLLRPPET